MKHSVECAVKFYIRNSICFYCQFKDKSQGATLIRSIRKRLNYKILYNYNDFGTQLQENAYNI